MIINLAKIRFGGGGGASAKPEDSFQETYTANGSYDITPEEGHVFSGGHVEVDVHPTESLSLTITESGNYTSNNEFNGYSINVDVEGPKPEETLTQTITENGSHVFNPSEGHVFNSASITVAVPDPVLGTLNVTPTTSEQNITAQAEGYKGFSEVNVSAVTSSIDSNIAAENIKKDVTILGVTGTLEGSGKDYRYKTGTPDVAGLTAIGWTADDIGYYGANTSSHYAWENDNYKVSQENIDLYSLDDPKPSLYKDNPNVVFVPNKNMSTYFGKSGAFDGMKYIKGIPLFDTSSATDMSQMFNECSSLQYIPPLDTSNVTSMLIMFGGCTSLTSIPQLDTSKVTSMLAMFGNCTSLTSIPQLDTSKVTDMSSMFQNCSSLTSIPQLDTSKVTSMLSMFFGCSSLQSIPQLDTSKVTDMSDMFHNCSALQTIPQLNTSNVTDMSEMFSSCTSLQSVDGIDFSSMTSSPRNFFGGSSLNKLTHFIVNGSINWSWNDDYGFYRTPNLDYESIKSILEAMNRTTNTNAKTMKFKTTIADQNGELTGLVSSCATKGWTVTGLTIN